MTWPTTELRLSCLSVRTRRLWPAQCTKDDSDTENFTITTVVLVLSTSMSTGLHLFLAVVAILSQHVQAADILVATVTYASPWMDVAKIAEELASRGHVVTVLAHASQKSDLMRKWPTLQYETFGDPETPPSIKEVAKTVPQKMAFSSSGMLGLLKFGSTLSSALLDLGEEMLSDNQLLTKLSNSHYDVVLTYAGPSYGPTVAQYLDLPLVCTMRSLPTGQDIRATGVPNPLAYVPTVTSELSDRMTFLQRVKNVLVYFAASTMGQLVLEKRYDDVAKRTIGEKFTMSAGLARTDVWLYQSDLMFDFPKPLMPNMVSIAGHMAEDVKPLSEELERFVQSSGDDGVVLVTFGSMIAAMPAELADMLAAAFARLPQKVVWRYAGTPPPSLGPNTKTMEWVPQNDLLAHPKTKAFVSHCGYNGVAEAMYHGVPLVGMPLMSDAHDNIARMVARGMAVSLNIHTVTSEEVAQAITSVISDPSFKEKANHISTHLRDQPQSPMERAVWWIEHVIKHGGLPHLRSRAPELPFYQYYLLDVIALIVAVISAVLLSCWKCCSFACGMCKRGMTSTKLKSN
ncbi:UDP-glucuronosyltransferase 2C1-like [Branchiostoma floridae]|uniref:UDP-glucuronosyltransferase 2C1-like n=1 Tax=Branchiostoma floridae TaxID=7739 RepID=A0A9J7M139_BRAFL|nr:UDP-glucuronosyltransferase 2C1-like [Branchiostoma floridae]